MSTIDIKLEKKRLEIARHELEAQVDSNYASCGLGYGACPVCKACGVLVSHRMKIRHIEFSHKEYYENTIKPLEDKIQSISLRVYD